MKKIIILFLILFPCTLFAFDDVRYFSQSEIDSLSVEDSINGDTFYVDVEG